MQLRLPVRGVAHRDRSLHDGPVGDVVHRVERLRERKLAFLSLDVRPRVPELILFAPEHRSHHPRELDPRHLARHHLDPAVWK